MKLRLPVVLFCTGLVLTGCAAWEFRKEHGESWVGIPISAVKLNYRSVESRTNEVGQKEYFHQYDGCELVWIVDARDIVVDWKHNGPGCVKTKPWSIHF